MAHDLLAWYEVNPYKKPSDYVWATSCQPRWSQACETAGLAERGNARLHSTRSSKTGDHQEDVVAHISPHIFYIVKGNGEDVKVVQELLRH